MSSKLPGSIPDVQTTGTEPVNGHATSPTGHAPALTLSSLTDTPPYFTPARKAWVESVSTLLRHKYLILGVTIVVTVVTGIYAFTKMPNMYRATSVILPARKAGGSLDNISAGIASSLKDLGMAKIGGTENSYSPLSLMTSRELQERVTKQFNLQQVYHSPTLADAVDEFSGNLQGDITQEGNFSVQFEDTDPVRAAKVTNGVVDAINEINSRLSIEEAKHNRTFVEARYQKNVADLDSAEKALGEFQRKYGVYSLPDQAKAELAAIAGLEQQRSSAEITLNSAEQIYGSNSSEASVARNTISGIASKLADMKAGMDMKASSFVPTNSMPDVALDYLRLMREVEIQSKLKAFLLPSYEQAKLDENKDLMGFITLDHATPPIHKSKPHRSVVLLIAMLGTFAVTSLVVLGIQNARSSYVKFLADQKKLGLA